MIEVDPRQIRWLEAELRRFGTRGVLYANAEALNSMAFLAQSGGRANIKSQFVNRNRFTVQSVQVDRARPVALRNQLSTVGSVAPYMDEQEFGGDRVKQGRRGVPIPTKAAAGMGSGPAEVRTRPVKASNRLSGLTLTRARTGGNRRQNNAIAVSMATRKGRHAVVFLDLGKRKGLFRVAGGAKRTTPKRITMLYDLSNTTVDIPRDPWLYPAVQFVKRRGPSLYIDALNNQVKRQQLFKMKRR